MRKNNKKSPKYSNRCERVLKKSQKKYEMQPAYMQHSLVLNAFLLCIHAGCILHFLL